MQLVEGVDYTVSAGVYTFAASLVGQTVTIAYQQPSTAVSALGQLGLSLAAGNMAQPVWGYLTTNYPSQAIGYSGISYLYAPAYDLGDSAEVVNHTFEVSTPWEQSFSVDADPGAVIKDVLTNGRYGANFPESRLGSFTALTLYARAQGLLMSPALTVQKPAAEWLRYLLDTCNSDCTWSQGTIKFVPLGDAAVTGNSVTYTPNTTPVYDLTEDHFITTSPGEDGVRVQRKSGEEAYNHVRVEYFNRANAYNTEIAEAKDAADIETRGLRTMETVEAHALCDTTAAQTLATLLLQRQMSVRNTYTFRLPWSFALVEPLDLLTLTYAPKGLASTPVRVNKIDEGDNDEFVFECEDAPIGMATAPLYGSQASTSFAHDYNAVPGNVTTPVIFEAPKERTQNGLEVYVAATGLTAEWGGCTVWVSLDGTTYEQAGRIVGGSRYGTLTNSPGTSGTVSIALLADSLASGASSDAAALNTLYYIGGASEEYASYQTATLTSPLNYDLTGGAVRGAYGTKVSAHTAGEPWVRIDENLGRSGPIDLSYIGKTVHIKLTSFNHYGLNEESLADVTDYTYLITGKMIAVAPADFLSVDVSKELSFSSPSGFGASPIELVRLSDTQAIVAYQDVGYGTSVAILSIDEYGVITRGTPIVLPSSYANTAVSCPIVVLSPTSFICLYLIQQAGPTFYNYPTAIVCTISGTTITAGTQVNINAVAEDGGSLMGLAYLTSTKVLATWFNSGPGHAKYRVLDISGTTITMGAELATGVFGKCGPTNTMVPLTSTTVLSLYLNNSQQATCRVMTISGSTVTAGTAYANTSKTFFIAPAISPVSVQPRTKAMVSGYAGGETVVRGFLVTEASGVITYSGVIDIDVTSGPKEQYSNDLYDIMSDGKLLYCASGDGAGVDTRVGVINVVGSVVSSSNPSIGGPPIAFRTRLCVLTPHLGIIVYRAASNLLHASRLTIQ